MFKLSKFILMITLLAFLLTGCRIRIVTPEENAARGNDPKSDFTVIDGNNSIEEALGNATSVKLDFSMSVGDFTFAGNDENLLKGESIFNRKSLEHKLTVTGEDEKVFKIKPAHHNMFNINLGGKQESKISASSPKAIPTEMKMNMGVGKSKVNLTGIDLSKLDLSCGVGDVYITMSEEYPQAMELDLEGGVGKFELNMEGNYKDKVTSDIEGGVGNINLDLTGTFENGASFNIESGVGSVYIKVSGEHSIRINGEKGVGSLTIEEDGKKTSIKNKEEYRSKNYKDDQPTINIETESGVGSIKIIIES